MHVDIRPPSADDMKAVVALSLLAWAPVFSSFAQVLGTRIFAMIYPDRQPQQRAVVEQVCAAHGRTTGRRACLCQGCRWTAWHGAYTECRVAA